MLKNLKYLIILNLLLMNVAISSTNLSTLFKNQLNNVRPLTSSEQGELKKYDIYFIPGILAESFIHDDERSRIDFSIITKDYFEKSLDVLNSKYNISAKRITTSSKNVNETRQAIREAVAQSSQNKRKAILISHSLGGLALLEELIENSSIQKDIAGIAFLQSPFYGSPLSQIVLDPSYEIQRYIYPLLPWVNVSKETIYYVGFEYRLDYMAKNRVKVGELIQNVPLYTFTGIASGKESIFKPLIEIIQFGCMKNVSQRSCVSSMLYEGPYEENDGLIPYSSSFIEGADYVVMEGIDHGEIILNIPFTDYKKELMTTSWLRTLLLKMKHF